MDDCERTENQSQDRSPKNGRRGKNSRRGHWPKKMMFFTAVVVGGLGLLHWQLDLWNERFNLDPGFVNILTIVMSLVLIGSWAIWSFFFAKARLAGAVIIALPAVFLTFFYPNLGGDANITGWTPRFWKAAVEYATTQTDAPEGRESGIDLLSASPHDFPQFLGRYRNGVVPDVELTEDWENRAPELMWKIPIGEGWSGFSAVNGFAITQEQRDEKECVTCYEIETGRLVWIHESHRRYEDIAALGKIGPRATPTLAGGRVYVTSGTGVLDCLDGANGNLIWSKDVPALVGIDRIEHTSGLGRQYTVEDSHLTWGRSGSPLVVGDLVIVPAGGPSDDPEQKTATLIAFDKISGEEVWRGGKRMISYGSPSMATLMGQPQILLMAEDHAVGHDPETGIELWSYERSGNSDADANCSQITPISDSQILLSKGYSMGGELVRFSKTVNDRGEGEEEGLDDSAGDGKDNGVAQNAGPFYLQSLHKDPRILKTKLTSPVIFEGHSYSLSDGYLECVEVDSFRRKWKQRGRFGNGQLLLVGNKLLVHAEAGQLLLVAADPRRYNQRGAIDTIKGICWNTMCLYEDQLLVRSELEAACYRIPAIVLNPTGDVNAANAHSKEHP